MSGRRDFLATAGKIVVAGGIFGHRFGADSAAAQSPKRPDPGTFESGDLLWPKPPGTVVPYHAGVTPASEAALWEEEKNAYTAAVFGKGNPAAGESRAASLLAAMRFAEFKTRYLDDDEPGTATPHTAVGPFYVGHVAVLHVHGGRVSVIESVRPLSRSLPYDQWLAERGQDDIWHGRLIIESAAKRANFAARAARYLARPYRFFNFDLADDSGLYCSKLVWLSAYLELNIALDDEAGTFRFPWYSPKRLMRSKHVCLKFDPGLYTSVARRCG